jgi:hypothetical protein
VEHPQPVGVGVDERPHRRRVVNVQVVPDQHHPAAGQLLVRRCDCGKARAFWTRSPAQATNASTGMPVLWHIELIHLCCVTGMTPLIAAVVVTSGSTYRPTWRRTSGGVILLDYQVLRIAGSGTCYADGALRLAMPATRRRQR